MDGGRTWHEAVPGPEEAHVNALAVTPSGAFVAACEFGLVFRSDDLGRSWQQLARPYHGSLFGALALSNGEILVFGLRGHVFRSNDGGSTWNEVESGTTASLMTGLQLADGRVILGGHGGTLLVSRDRAQSFELVERREARGIADLVELPGGQLLLIGEGGLRRIEAPDGPAIPVALDPQPRG